MQAIMHLLELAIYEHMAKIGYQPLLFISRNIPGGAENNAKIYEKYINTIRFW